MPCQRRAFTLPFRGCNRASYRFFGTSVRLSHLAVRGRGSVRHDIARKIRRSNIRLSPIFTVPKATLDVRNWSFNVIPARKSARRCCVRPRLCAARPRSATLATGHHFLWVYCLTCRTTHDIDPHSRAALRRGRDQSYPCASGPPPAERAVR
jgi:hypothetical protein